MSSWIPITAFVVSIIVAIMLHELGHFLTARRFGMRADRFFLGFGPTLWSTRRGETEYGVKALPLGGFVRIIGMAPDDERRQPVDALLFSGAPSEVDDSPWFDDEREASLRKELDLRGASAETTQRIVRRMRASVLEVTDRERARSIFHEIVTTEVDSDGRVGDLRHRILQGDEQRFFHERPAWQRAIVLVAGSAAHFAIAIAVLVGAYSFLPLWTGELSTTVAEIADASPAHSAGLQAGDRVVGVNDVRTERYERLRDEIRANPRTPIELHIIRDGDALILDMTPTTVETAGGDTIGVVGFSPHPVMERKRPAEAIEHALFGTPQPGNPGGFVPMFTGSIDALTSVFSPSGISTIVAQATGQQERAIDGAVSLVGAASIAGQVGDGVTGAVLFLGLIAVVNVFIGIFNLAPLPPLDGGHLAVLGIERAVNGIRQLRRKPADFQLDPRAIAAVAVPVLAVLAVLVTALLWLDITDPIRLG